MTRPLKNMASMSTLPSRQAGITWLGWLAVLVVIIVFGTLAINTVPDYLEYNTVRATINEVMQDSRTDLKSKSEIRVSLRKHFNIDNVTALKAKDLAISKANGELSIGVDYKVKNHLFANMYILLHFKHTFEKTLTQ